jgi:hypothetical protein
VLLSRHSVVLEIALSSALAGTPAQTGSPATPACSKQRSALLALSQGARWQQGGKDGRQWQALCHKYPHRTLDTATV